jgi:hypothetical protein
MPMIDVSAAARTSASKHDLAQQLAAAVMRRGQASPIAHRPLPGKRRSVTPTSTGSPIKTQIRKIDGLSVPYAESEPRDVAAILLSPRPESLCTLEQMWSRLAGPGSASQAGRRNTSRVPPRGNGGTQNVRPIVHGLHYQNILSGHDSAL